MPQVLLDKDRTSSLPEKKPLPDVPFTRRAIIFENDDLGANGGSGYGGADGGGEIGGGGGGDHGDEEHAKPTSSL